MNTVLRLCLIAALVVFVPANFALAQHEEHHAEAQEEEASQQMGMCPMCKMRCGMMGQMMKGGMMGEGMMGMGMNKEGMADPVCKILHRFGAPGLYEKYADELGLSDKQMMGIKAIWSDHEKAAIRKKADIEIA